MIKSTNFIDLLFILLCGTIVMLSQSIQLGGVEGVPAKVGGGSVSEIQADQVRVVGVADDFLAYEDGKFPDANQVLQAMDADAVVVLIPSDALVSHHRVMAVWSQFSAAGKRVQIGVQSDHKKPSPASAS